MIAPAMHDRMIRPRGAELVIPKGTSMLARFNAEHAALVIAARAAKQLADDADENAKAPVTIGTRTWL